MSRLGSKISSFLLLSIGAALLPRPSAAQCIQLAQADQAQPPQSSPAGAGRRATELTPQQKRLLMPLTAAELKILIAVLSAPQTAQSAKPSSRARASGGGPSEGVAIQLPKGPRGMTLPRLGILMQDITAVLVRAELEETIQQIPHSSNTDPRVAAWAEQLSRALEQCTQQRYAGFGGDPIYRQVRQLVLNNRTVLERLIVGARLPEPASAAGQGQP
jgi:hypothetical protein